MKVQACNLWFEQAEYRCVITSGARESDGSATMDHPSAIEAKKRYQGLEVDLGRLISARGNHVHLIRPGIIAFPTKQYAWSKPDRAIIRRSATELAAPGGRWKDPASCASRANRYAILGRRVRRPRLVTRYGDHHSVTPGAACARPIRRKVRTRAEKLKHPHPRASLDFHVATDAKIASGQTPQAPQAPAAR